MLRKLNIQLIADQIKRLIKSAFNSDITKKSNKSSEAGGTSIDDVTTAGLC
jgi:hypothetical protein